MASIKIKPKDSLQKEVERILQKRTVMKFDRNSDIWIASIYRSEKTERYAVAATRNKSYQNVISAEGNLDRPTTWLIDLEDEWVEFLDLPLLFRYKDPVIVKVDYQFFDNGILDKVNFSISDRCFDFDIKIPEDHDGPDILKLYAEMYDIHTVDVHVPL